MHKFEWWLRQLSIILHNHQGTISLRRWSVGIYRCSRTWSYFHMGFRGDWWARRHSFDVRETHLRDEGRSHLWGGKNHGRDLCIMARVGQVDLFSLWWSRNQDIMSTVTYWRWSSRWLLHLPYLHFWRTCQSNLICRNLPIWFRWVECSTKLSTYGLHWLQM